MGCMKTLYIADQFIVMNAKCPPVSPVNFFASALLIFSLVSQKFDYASELQFRLQQFGSGFDF